MIEPTASEQNTKPAIVMSVTINFEHMTWGELRKFTTLADRNNIHDDQVVALAFDHGDDFEPFGLTFTSHLGADGDI